MDKEKRNKTHKGCSPLCVAGLALLFFITISVFALRILMQLDGNPFATMRCANTAHTASHADWIADDQGKVCRREDFDNEIGCCEKSVSSFERGCNLNCNETARCCTIYEFCIACCLSPFSESVVDEFKRQTRDIIYSSLLTEKDSFEFCKAKCRTSSHSVIGENKYRSVWKHCYGGAPPPLQIETTVVDSLSIMEKANKPLARPSVQGERGPGAAEGGNGQRAGRSLSVPAVGLPSEQLDEQQPPHWGEGGEEGIVKPLRAAPVEVVASNDPTDNFQALQPEEGINTGKSRITSSANTLSGHVWWLHVVLAWPWQSSDFTAALYIVTASVLVLARRTLW